MTEMTRIPYGIAVHIATWIQSKMEPHVIRSCAAGSLRRKKPDVGDLDIVAIPKPNWKPASDAVKALSKETLTEGPSFSRFIVQYESWTVKVELWWTTEENWPFMLLKRTGSNNFNIRMAIATKARGGTLSEYGIYYPRGSKNRLLVQHEGDIFKWLGWPWVAPENREYDIQFWRCPMMCGYEGFYSEVQKHARGCGHT